MRKINRSLMRYRVRKRMEIAILVVVVLIMSSSYQTITYAQSVWGSHLIQTTDYQDEYCGALRLGLLETTAQESADIEQVEELVSACIVRIHCGDSVGSGIVLDLTEDNVVIVSNAHLLQNDVKCAVDFLQGFSADGEIVSYAEQYDMAFVKVPLQNIPMQQWECLRYVDKQIDFGQVTEGDAVVQIGSSQSVAGDCYRGGILKKKQYVPDYGSEMMRAGCQAYTGMSGGGVFDNKGHLIGMITAGDMTQNTREDGTEITYSITIDVILEELYSVISCF